MKLDLHAEWKSDKSEGNVSFKFGSPRPHYGPVETEGHSNQYQTNSSQSGKDNSLAEGSSTSTSNWAWGDVKSLLTVYKMVKESGIDTDVGSLMDRLSNADSYISTCWRLAKVIIKWLLWLFTT